MYHRGENIRDVESWVNWIVKFPQLAEKHYPKSLDDLKTRIKNQDPIQTALFIKKIPELFCKWKAEAKSLFGSTRLKFVKNHLELINLLLVDLEFDNEIINEAIEIVRVELTEQKQSLEETLMNSSPQPEKKVPKLKNGSILFNSPETIDKLYNGLKSYFPEQDKILFKVLNGEQCDEELIFLHNQNQLVEVFRRAKYNGLIISTSTELANWLTYNFSFRYSRGKTTQVRKFNRSTVWPYLTKDLDVSRKNRICIFDWCPYKSFEQRRRDKEKGI
jgi:hypothetical protein